MAMAKVCLNLRSTQFLQRVASRYRSRPTPFPAFLSRDRQLSIIPRDTPPAGSLFTPPFISISSHCAFMEKGSKVSALSESASKAIRDLEDHGTGGDGRDDGNGSGFGGNGGNGGDDSPKGDHTPPNSFFSWYFLLLNNHPVTTKAITSALISLFGDLVCQLLIEKSETINLKRSGIFALLGLVLVGPTLHFWYLTLSKLVPGPGSIKAGSRLVLDQFLFSPIFIAVFLSAMLTLEGHPHDIAPKLKQDMLNVVVTNWKIWIPFQFLNFLFVPQQLQVLAANVISLAWNTYLSFAAHRDVLAPAQKDSVTS